MSLTYGSLLLKLYVWNMDILCLKLCVYSYVEKYTFIHSFIKF